MNATDIGLAAALGVSLAGHAWRLVRPHKVTPAPAAPAFESKAFEPTTGHILTIAPTGAPPEAGPGITAVVTAFANPEVPAP